MQQKIFTRPNKEWKNNKLNYEKKMIETKGNILDTSRWNRDFLHYTFLFLFQKVLVNFKCRLTLITKYTNGNHRFATPFFIYLCRLKVIYL